MKDGNETKTVEEVKPAGVSETPVVAPEVQQALRAIGKQYGGVDPKSKDLSAAIIEMALKSGDFGQIDLNVKDRLVVALRSTVERALRKKVPEPQRVRFPRDYLLLTGSSVGALLPLDSGATYFFGLLPGSFLQGAYVTAAAVCGALFLRALGRYLDHRKLDWKSRDVLIEEILAEVQGPGPSTPGAAS